MAIADHHRVVVAMENPVRSATSKPFSAEDLPFIWFPWFKENADALQSAKQHAN
jgi:hypothetical protein